MNRKAMIAPRLGGVVAKVMVREQGTVEAGTRLVDLADREWIGAVRTAAAARKGMRKGTRPVSSTPPAMPPREPGADGGRLQATTEAQAAAEACSAYEWKRNLRQTRRRH